VLLYVRPASTLEDNEVECIDDVFHMIVINSDFTVKCINQLVFVLETRYVFCEVKIKVPLCLTQRYEMKAYRLWRCSFTHSEPCCLEVRGKVHAPATVPPGENDPTTR
jgi:hypothetical protein